MPAIYLGRRLKASQSGGPLEIIIQPRTGNNVRIVRLRGELRVGNSVDSLRIAINNLLAEGESRIVFNLAEVPMIDSTGIGVLLRSLTMAKQRGGGVRLVKPSLQAVNTLKIVGLIDLFQMFDEEENAAASFH